MTQTLMCPCKSGTSFLQCCSPYLQNEKLPSNPLTLMRSRYSAYVLKKIDYLVNTQCNSSDPHEIEAFAKAAYFQNLEIIEYGEDFVEFKAYYILDHHQELLHEKSFFTCAVNDSEEVLLGCKDEKWCYKNGTLFSTQIAFKRNDICICGSGKKYKKCCALL